MIYIYDFNSALDYKINLPNNLTTLSPSGVIRYNNEEIHLGGKGINNAILLNNLEINSTIFGFNGGFIGEEISKQFLNYFKINYDPVYIKNNNRINIKAFNGKHEWEINGQGPIINDDEANQLISKYNQINSSDFVIVSGSKPNYDDGFFEEIIRKIVSKKPCLIIDTTGKTLLNCLKYKPFLIKPNINELEDILQVKLKHLSNSEIVKHTKKLINLGAQNVIVSLGKKGAILISSSEKSYYAISSPIKVKNTIGSGDSLVSGFLCEFIKTKSIKKSFIFGVACATASATKKHLANKKEIEIMYNNISWGEIK